MKQLAARVSVWCIEIERTVYTLKALFPCYFDDYYIWVMFIIYQEADLNHFYCNVLLDCFSSGCTLQVHTKCGLQFGSKNIQFTIIIADFVFTADNKTIILHCLPLEFFSFCQKYFLRFWMALHTIYIYGKVRLSVDDFTMFLFLWNSKLQVGSYNYIFL